MAFHHTANHEDEAALNAKVAFLCRRTAYSFAVDEVVTRETHMSWVFLAGDRVYKLKKPLRSPFLDFSTCSRREAACREEFRLNRRLAKETYIGVVPLTLSGGEFAIDGDGRAVDWLVVMHRLDERFMLEENIRQDRLRKPDLDALATLLAKFYRHAEPSTLGPNTQIAEWKRGLCYNRQVLLSASLRLPGGLIRQIERLQEDFVSQCGDLFIQRSRAGLIVDAHGDLRPEHIWLGEPPQIIDCLEFNRRLRTLDALSEIAFLDLECERLGASWAGKYLRMHIFGKLPALRNDALFHFYRSYHAMVRARLAIAHLLEPHPRKPQKWRPLALSYLRLASADTRKLQQLLKRLKGPSKIRSHAACGSSRR
jgi:aminoglycoside phosphotransferase family enzyme